MILLLLYFGSDIAQTLQVSRVRFGKVKKHEFYQGDMFEYKPKGDRRFRKDMITAFDDSTIFFLNGSGIRLYDIKKIRFRRENRVLAACRAFFIRGGIIFFTVDTINNLIFERETVVNEKAALIASGLVVTGLIFKRFEHGILRNNKGLIIKVVDQSYNHLGPP